MLPEEYENLKNDLLKNGYDKSQPIYLFENCIIDGWNRQQACNELKIDPVYIEFKGSNIDAINFVMRTNKRRNLTSSQWACIAIKEKDIISVIKAEAKERQGKRNDLNIVQQIAQSQKSNETIAGLFNTNKQYIRDAEKIKSEQPEEYQKIYDGEKTITELKKENRKKEVQVKINKLKQKETLPPTGKYDVIVIDPPWPMEKIEREVAPNQVGFDYPTMSIQEIIDYKMPVEKAEKDCHVFMWTTQKYLPHSFEIFKAWNIKYIYTGVWHKNGGFQPFGLPQYNCEFYLYGRIGTPQFIDFKNFFTCFSADRTGHSEKPEIFYETLRRVTAGQRLDIFNRRKIKGFKGVGNEGL